MRKILAILAFLLIVSAGTVLLLQRGTNPPRTVSVSFGGFTNDSAGARLATFCVSNCSRGSIIRWGNYGVETRQTPWHMGAQAVLGPKAILRPGQTESVSLPAPTNTAAWKAVLFFSREGWRSRSNANTNSLLMRITAQHGLSMPTEVWKSEWFAQ